MSQPAGQTGPSESNTSYNGALTNGALSHAALDKDSLAPAASPYATPAAYNSPRSDYAAPPPGGYSRYWMRAFQLPLLIALCCGLGAWLTCTFLLTKWYSAGTTLYFASPSGSGTANILSDLTGGSASSDGTIPFQNGLYYVPRVGNGPGTAMMAMASTRCIIQVLTECRLPQRWHLPADKAARRLTKNISYGVDKNGLLSVQFSDPDPKLAVQVVNSYIEAMRTVTTELSVFYARRTRQALEAELARQTKELQNEQDTLVQLQSRAAHGLPLGATTAADYSRLDVQRQETVTALNQTQAQIDRSLQAARLAMQTGTSLPAEVPFAQAEGERLRTLQIQLYKAQDTLGPNNPDLLSLQTQVAQAQALYKREINSQLNAVQQGIAPEVAPLYVQQKGLQARLTSIQALMAPLRSRLASTLPKMPVQQMRITRLESQIKTSQMAVEAMTLETERARETESRTVPTFEVVDAANVPQLPTLPHTGLTTAFAAVAGFLLALAWRVARAVSRHPSVAGELQRLAELYDLAPAAPALAPALPVPHENASSEASRPRSLTNGASSHGATSTSFLSNGNEASPTPPPTSS